MKGIAALVLLASVALAACGGAEAKAPPPQSPTPEPRTVEEAQEEIARAQRALEGDIKKSVQPEPPAKADLDKPSSSPEGLHYESACARSCRALDSMRRAVEALCRMTGDTDTRCVDARRVLTDSATRMAACECERP